MARMGALACLRHLKQIRRRPFLPQAIHRQLPQGCGSALPLPSFRQAAACTSPSPKAQILEASGDCSAISNLPRAKGDGFLIQSRELLRASGFTWQPETPLGRWTTQHVQPANVPPQQSQQSEQCNFFRHGAEISLERRHERVRESPALTSSALTRRGLASQHLSLAPRSCQAAEGHALAGRTASALSRYFSNDGGPKLSGKNEPLEEPSGREDRAQHTKAKAQECQQTTLIPPSLLPYWHLARLDKPIGTWLLVWPCFWSITLATPNGAFPDFGLLALFGIGSVLMRGAGCTVNDILDKDFDARVARTRGRPLASGALSTKAAVGFLGLQLLSALNVLLQLNQFSQILGAAALPLVFTYPLMKRVTNWPQAFLGLTFNWGALLGWAAVQGSLDPFVVLPLYIGGVSWTLVYDTIYAHQDKEDDALVGVRSTARLFGDRTRTYLSGFALTTALGLSVAGYNAGLGLPFLVAMAGPSAHLAWQVFSTDFNNGNDCLRKFQANRGFGALVLLAIVAGKLGT